MRQRAALGAHGHHPNRPYNLPELGQKSASKATRDGVAERCADPAVPKTMAGDLAWLIYYDPLLGDVALAIVKAAKPHDAHTLDLLQTVPGIGTRLSLVLLYEMHAIDCLPTVQAVVSSCRRSKWAKESAGKRIGTSGKNMGNAHLTGAFAEAATLFVRTKPAG